MGDRQGSFLPSDHEGALAPGRLLEALAGAASVWMGTDGTATPFPLQDSLVRVFCARLLFHYRRICSSHPNLHVKRGAIPSRAGPGREARPGLPRWPQAAGAPRHAHSPGSPAAASGEEFHSGPPPSPPRPPPVPGSEPHGPRGGGGGGGEPESWRGGSEAVA